MYFRREFALAGGLMSYGTNTDENFQVMGEYTGRILKGEKSGDLPIQQSTNFEFVINLKTAKALGLTIPPGIRAIADEVIERIGGASSSRSSLARTVAPPPLCAGPGAPGSCGEAE